MNVLRILRSGAKLQLGHLATDRFMLFGVIVQPFFIAVTVMFMLRHRPDFDPVYVVIGSAVSGLWSTLLFSGTWIIGSERWLGTLELVAGSPPPLMLIFAARLLGTMAYSLLSLALNYTIGAWLFGYELGLRDPVGFLVSLPLALFALWCVGVLIAPIGVLWRPVARFLTILEYPVFMLGGFMFPILLMPAWSNGVSYALPPYWAAEALHATSSGTTQWGSLPAVWAALLATSLATLAIAVPFYALVLRRARRAGTLALT